MLIFDTSQNPNIDWLPAEFPDIRRMNFLHASNVGWVPPGSPPTYDESYWVGRIHKLLASTENARIDPRSPTLLDIEWIEHFGESGQALLYDIAEVYARETGYSNQFMFYRLFPAKAGWEVLNDDTEAITTIKKNNTAMMRSRDPRGRWDHRGPADLVQATTGWAMHWVPSMSFDIWKKIPEFAVQESKKYQKPCWLWMPITYHPGRQDAKGKLVPLDLYERSIDWLAEIECDGIIVGSNGNYDAPSQGVLNPDDPQILPYLELLQNKAQQYRGTQFNLPS